MQRFDDSTAAEGEGARVNYESLDGGAYTFDDPFSPARDMDAAPIRAARALPSPLGAPQRSAPSTHGASSNEKQYLSYERRGMWGHCRCVQTRGEGVGMCGGQV